MSRSSAGKIGKSGEQKNIPEWRNYINKGKITSKYGMFWGNNVYIEQHFPKFDSRKVLQEIP